MTSGISAIDRERLGSGYLPPWVLNEHRARWRFASGLVQGKVCVDCACGVGEGTAMFANAGASHVHGFDLSDDAVNAAKQRCAGLPNVTIRKSSALSLPLASSSVDIFVSLETIEHLDHDREFLAEVGRVLSADGTLVCSTPNRSVTMPGKKISDKPWNPFHVREYGVDEFVTLLKDGFRTIRLLGQNPRAAWRVRLLETIGRLAPGNIGGRVNSALKLPRLIFDSESHHRVREIPSFGTCEYLVAVCTRPIKE